MTDRRITSHQHKHGRDDLKEIVGRIMNLNYSDMVFFSERIVMASAEGDEAADVARNLIDICTEILDKKD